MKPNAKIGVHGQAARHRTVTMVTLCLSALLAGASCRKRAVTHSPPDLSRCTRIEVRYQHSAFDVINSQFGPDEWRGVISPDDIAHLKSLQTISVVDQKRIKSLAREVARSTYQGPRWGEAAIFFTAYITGYRGDREVTSFSLQGLWVFEGGNKFQLERRVDLEGVAAEVRPFVLRVRCAERLAKIRPAVTDRVAKAKVAMVDFSSHWCDVVGWSPKGDSLKCPAATNGGPCHYAMNAAWEPNSPPDTVLLFETNAGWNQHGGPELFTFDNHDPKGGCVLLNDGTVKFIRTKEDLAQLRWKP